MYYWSDRRHKPRKPKPGCPSKSASPYGVATIRVKPRDPLKARTVGDYLDAISGDYEVTRDATIRSAMSIMSSTRLNNYVEHENAQHMLMITAPEERAVSPYAMDIDASITLHRAIMTGSITNSEADRSSAHVNWFDAYGEEAELKRSSLGAPLAQFLQTVELAKPAPLPRLEISSPATMFGQDDVVCWNTYSGGNCILLYRISNDRGGVGGLVAALDDYRCCWRQSLWEKPRDDWRWTSLQQALVMYLAESQQADGVPLQHRPKSSAGREGDAMDV